MGILFFVVVAVVLVVVWMVTIYNTLIGLIKAIYNNKAQIDVQLDRRAKVYDSLIEVVKKYMDYEKSTLKEVVALRAKAQQAVAGGDENARMSAENEISKIGTNLNVMFEQYPDLKADKNALQLQEEIVNTENKLTFAKQAYNDSIEKYEAKSNSLFESFIVGMFPKKLLDHFTYWGISDEVRKEREDYRVKM